MSKNIELYNDQDLSLALPVPDGTAAGDVFVINGLVLYALNAKTTQTLLDQGANVGCDVGTASCVVRGKSLTVRLPITGAINALDKVYKTSGGAYTATASSNTHVGWSTTTLTTDGTAVVIVL